MTVRENGPRAQFRQQVRARALDVARERTLSHGWSQVRFTEIADAVGVSRPTMYSEFGNKDGLGQALLRDETTVFLAGLISEIGLQPADVASIAKAALRYTVTASTHSPLLHAVLTNAGDADLLALLSTRSGLVLDLAVRVLTDWFGTHFPQYQQELLGEVTESLVRLTLSHLVQPSGDVESTLAVLERTTDLLIGAAIASEPGAAPRSTGTAR